jgi:hypothetical protein
VCGSSDIVHYPSRLEDFLIERMSTVSISTNMVACNFCGFITFDPLPSKWCFNNLYQNYRDDAYQKQRQKYEWWYTREVNEELGNDEKSKKRISLAIANLLQNHTTSVLDFGGDHGQHISSIPGVKKYVHDISGVPLDSGVERSEKGMKFDLILCCHLLEHIPDLHETMEEIRAYSHEGTWYYFEVPAEHWINSWWKKAASKYYPFHKMHEHINQFTPKSLTILLQHHNIATEEAKEQDVISCTGQYLGDKS